MKGLGFKSQSRQLLFVSVFLRKKPRYARIKCGCHNKMNINDFYATLVIQKSVCIDQNQTVIVKNLNAVASTRCPSCKMNYIVYENKLIQENTYRYTVRFRFQKSENTTEIAAL
jgi:hypothetical protein